MESISHHYKLSEPDPPNFLNENEPGEEICAGDFVWFNRYTDRSKLLAQSYGRVPGIFECLNEFEAMRDSSSLPRDVSVGLWVNFLPSWPGVIRAVRDGGAGSADDASGGMGDEQRFELELFLEPREGRMGLPKPLVATRSELTLFFPNFAHWQRAAKFSRPTAHCPSTWQGHTPASSSLAVRPLHALCEMSAPPQTIVPRAVARH